MPIPRPVLDNRSFDDLVDDLARNSLLGHELPHVVQQTSTTEAGRRRLAFRLKDADPVLGFALTSGAPLTERQSEKLAHHLTEQATRGR